MFAIYKILTWLYKPSDDLPPTSEINASKSAIVSVSASLQAENSTSVSPQPLVAKKIVRFPEEENIKTIYKFEKDHGPELQNVQMNSKFLILLKDLGLKTEMILGPPDATGNRERDELALAEYRDMIEEICLTLESLEGNNKKMSFEEFFLKIQPLFAQIEAGKAAGNLALKEKMFKILFRTYASFYPIISRAVDVSNVNESYVNLPPIRKIEPPLMTESQAENELKNYAIGSFIIRSSRTIERIENFVSFKTLSGVEHFQLPAEYTKKNHKHKYKFIQKIVEENLSKVNPE